MLGSPILKADKALTAVKWGWQTRAWFFTISTLLALVFPVGAQPLLLSLSNMRVLFMVKHLRAATLEQWYFSVYWWIGQCIFLYFLYWMCSSDFSGPRLEVSHHCEWGNALWVTASMNSNYLHSSGSLFLQVLGYHDNIFIIVVGWIMAPSTFTTYAPRPVNVSL